MSPAFVRRLKQRYRASGRLEYSPQHSPDLGPIGTAFGKFKGLLRKAAARTVDGGGDALRDAVARFGPAECLNDLRHGGYVPATAT